jgi:hypothetical protein
MAEFAFSVNVDPSADQTVTINHNLNSTAVRVSLVNNKVFPAVGAYKVYEVNVVDANNVSVTLFQDMFSAGAVSGKVVTMV